MFCRVYSFWNLFWICLESLQVSSRVPGDEQEKGNGHGPWLQAHGDPSLGELGSHELAWHGGKSGKLGFCNFHLFGKTTSLKKLIGLNKVIWDSKFASIVHQRVQQFPFFPREYCFRGGCRRICGSCFQQNSKMKSYELLRNRSQEGKSELLFFLLDARWFQNEPQVIHRWKRLFLAWHNDVMKHCPGYHSLK